jgi:hypothetical protein
MGQSASRGLGYVSSRAALPSEEEQLVEEVPDVALEVEVEVNSDNGSTKPTEAEPEGAAGFPQITQIRTSLVAICELNGHSATSIGIWSLDQLGVARAYHHGQEHLQWSVDEKRLRFVPCSASDVQPDAAEKPPAALHESVIRCCSIADGGPDSNAHVAIAWESGMVGLMDTCTGQQLGQAFLCSDMLVDDICICTGT